MLGLRKETTPPSHEPKNDAARFCQNALGHQAKSLHRRHHHDLLLVGRDAVARSLAAV
jgi:hypothetical protein